MVRIVLTSVEPELADAWRRFCGDLPVVEIVERSILDVPADAVVSPANSFGFMDGGIDMLYSRHYGWHVQERLQELIRRRHHGELLVGAAEIVPTDDPRQPYLIAAPTMRVPMTLRDSVNPYLAARAVLLLIRYGHFPDAEGAAVADRVQRVAFPGLATGVGGVEPDSCARQLRAAIDEVLLGQNAYPASWMEATERHQLLYRGRLRR